MARKGSGKLPENAGPSDAERIAKLREQGIGAGMHSPDSTQMPLRADTGEPDWDAVRGRPGGMPGQPGEERGSQSKAESGNRSHGEPGRDER